MKMALRPRNAAFAVCLHLLILSGQWQPSSAISSVPVAGVATVGSGGNSSENVLLQTETSTGMGPTSGTKRTCSNVHSIFEQRGFNTANMPTDPVTGECRRYLSFFFSENR